MLSTDKQTNKQTNRQINATKNITSFAKEVMSCHWLISSLKLKWFHQHDFLIINTELRRKDEIVMYSKFPEDRFPQFFGLLSFSNPEIKRPKAHGPMVTWLTGHVTLRIAEQLSLCYILIVGVNEIYFGNNCPKCHQAWVRYDNEFVETELMLYYSCFRTRVRSVVI